MKKAKACPSRNPQIIDRENCWFYEKRGSIDMIYWSGLKGTSDRTCHSFRIPWKVLIQSAKRCRPEEFK